MRDDNDTAAGHSRRSVLRKSGASIVTLSATGVLGSAFATERAAAGCSYGPGTRCPDWQTADDCTVEIDHWDGKRYDHNFTHGTTLAYWGVAPEPSEGKWEHHFHVTGEIRNEARCPDGSYTDCGGDGWEWNQNPDISEHRIVIEQGSDHYGDQLSGLDPDSNITIEDDKQDVGATPVPYTESSFEKAAETLVSSAIGSLSTYAGWAITAGTIVDQLTQPQDLDGMGHTWTYDTGYEPRANHYYTFEVQCDPGKDLSLTVASEADHADGYGTTGNQYEIEAKTPSEEPGTEWKSTDFSITKVPPSAAGYLSEQTDCSCYD